VAVGVLAVHVTLFVLATGGLRSALVSLYVIPLTALALAFGRWRRVLALAIVIAALGVLLGVLQGFMLGAHRPDTDLESTRVAVGVLGQLAPGIAVALIVALLTGNMRSAAQRISDLAATDPLTGLLNLHSFEEVWQQEHRKAERFGRTYTLVVLDVDNLAPVNELLGLDAGNQVLVGVAAAISRSIRASDVAARLGGDDFVVLLTEADADTGANVANRQLRASASLGVANFPKDHLYPKELLMLAQQRMQQDRLLRGAAAASN
jgi:diguanylate cyclase (GGDEF)-like protein